MTIHSCEESRVFPSFSPTVPWPGGAGQRQRPSLPPSVCRGPDNPRCWACPLHCTQHREQEWQEGVPCPASYQGEAPCTLESATSRLLPSLPLPLLGVKMVRFAVKGGGVLLHRGLCELVRNGLPAVQRPQVTAPDLQQAPRGAVVVWL